MGNQWEEAARARRVAIMVSYFDRRVRELHGHPINDAERIAKWLRGSTTAEQWASHALLAGLKKPPSQTTIDAIIAVYEDRDRNEEVSVGAEVLPIQRLGGLH